MSATAREQNKHIRVEKKMGEFYLALGAFNTAVIEKMLTASGDSNVLDKLIDQILDAGCEIHDRECQTGYIWDHQLNACVKVKDVINEGQL